jgi:DNA-binding response OmpR family regulator
MPEEIVAHKHAYALAYIFDDDPAVGQTAADLLSAAGISAQQFTDSKRFFAAVARRFPDVVLLDLGLDRTDAVEVIRHLEALRFSGAVLLISGRDSDLLNRVKEVGVAHGLAMLPSLQKPFRIFELEHSLASTPIRSAPTHVC